MGVQVGGEGDFDRWGRGVVKAETRGELMCGAGGRAVFMRGELWMGGGENESRRAKNGLRRMARDGIDAKIVVMWLGEK